MKVLTEGFFASSQCRNEGVVSSAEHNSEITRRFHSDPHNRTFSSENRRKNAKIMNNQVFFKVLLSHEISFYQHLNPEFIVVKYVLGNDGMCDSFCDIQRITHSFSCSLDYLFYEFRKDRMKSGDI